MRLPATKLLVLCLVVALVQGCTSVKVKTGVSSDLSAYSNAYIAQVKVVSVEQHGGALTTNKRIEVYAKNGLRKLIKDSDFQYTNSTGSDALGFILDLDITYGVRALRWGVGFGAGKGTVYSTFEIFDSQSGETKYSATSSSDLIGGFQGGSMETLIQKQIEKQLKAFLNSTNPN